MASDVGVPLKPNKQTNVPAAVYTDFKVISVALEVMSYQRTTQSGSLGIAGL